MQHLIMRLESPLMAFGGETIDNLGVIRPFPAASMLTGLLANALGWRRVERELHRDLQDRLVFAARIDREPAMGVRMTDYQTVKMGDTVDLFVRSGHWVMGWTTRGEPDERAGQLGAVGSGPFTHQRWRDYWADMLVTVALRLEPAENVPTLDDLAAALQEPARPLFIGRKPCLPASPLYQGLVEAGSVLSALLEKPLADARNPANPVRLFWPPAEDNGQLAANRTYMITDQRNWISGLHGGGRPVCEGTTTPDKFGPPSETPSPAPSTEGEAQE